MTPARAAWPATVLLLLAACGGPSPAGRPSGAVHRPVAVARSAARRAPAVPADAVAESVLGQTPVATVSHQPPGGPGQEGVTVVVFDPARTRLVLHAGSVLPGRGAGWPYGPVIGAAERGRVLAAFNGGFKLASSRGGWVAGGRPAVPLVTGAASVVTYRDGGTDVGAWGSEVPAPGRAVASVRQNLQLLVDRGRAVLTDPGSQQRLEQVWGHTYKHESLVARSALGVTADGALVWAAGLHTSVRALAAALLAHGAVRALELDINAPMVRGFLFSGAAQVRLRSGARLPVLPLVVGQTQGGSYPSGGPVPHCTYVLPCPRDFFTVLVR